MANDSHIAESVTGAIILAGGYSSRMSHPKAWLPFNEEQSFLSHIVDEYEKFGCEKIIIVLNQAFYNDRSLKLLNGCNTVTVVKNDYPEKGRNYSLQLGINQLPEIAYTFIQNVDSPFVSAKILQALYQNRNNRGYTSPTYKERGGHPILLSEKLVKKIDLTAGSLKDCLKDESKTCVEVNDEGVLVNINTPEEFEKYFPKLEKA